MHVAETICLAILLKRTPLEREACLPRHSSGCLGATPDLHGVSRRRCTGATQALLGLHRAAGGCTGATQGLLGTAQALQGLLGPLQGPHRRCWGLHRGHTGRHTRPREASRCLPKHSGALHSGCFEATPDLMGSGSYRGRTGPTHRALMGSHKDRTGPSWIPQGCTGASWDPTEVAQGLLGPAQGPHRQGLLGAVQGPHRAPHQASGSIPMAPEAVRCSTLGMPGGHARLPWGPTGTKPGFHGVPEGSHRAHTGPSWAPTEVAQGFHGSHKGRTGASWDATGLTQGLLGRAQGPHRQGLLGAAQGPHRQGLLGPAEGPHRRCVTPVGSHESPV